MFRVGYIAADSLRGIQEQWEKLLDAEVDMALFDWSVVNDSDVIVDEQERQEARIYMESMRAGQGVLGNRDGYLWPSDLGPEDNFVLTTLDVLYCAKPDLWPEIMSMVAKGVGLEVLEYRFCSRGGYGDVMLDGMNIMFEYGKFVQKVTSGTYTPHPRYKA